MKRVLNVYYKLQSYLLAATFAVVVAVCFFQVLNRTFFKLTVQWPEELARYLIVWLVFIGSIAAFRRGAMVGVDILTSRFEGRLKLVFNIIQKVITILFAAVVTYFCIIIIQTQIGTNQLSAALKINMAIPYSAIPVWGVLTVIEMSASTAKDIIRLRNPPASEPQ